MSMADLRFAYFIGRCEATPWKAQQEKFIPSERVLFEREYDDVTDANLAFIRGQIVAEQTIEQRTAA